MTYKGDSSLGGSTRLECPGRNHFDSETKSHINKPCNKVRRLGEQQRSQVVYIFNIANTSWIWQVGWCSRARAANSHWTTWSLEYSDQGPLSLGLHLFWLSGHSVNTNCCLYHSFGPIWKMKQRLSIDNLPYLSECWSHFKACLFLTVSEKVSKPILSFVILPLKCLVVKKSRSHLVADSFWWYL